MIVKQIPVVEFLLIAVIVSVLTLATAWVYPIWDDARLLVLINHSGDKAIRLFFDSRVLVSQFSIFLFHHGLFLPAGLVLHWLSWFGMGLITYRFWQLTFPAHARFAMLPAILAVTPILCKVQFVVMSVVFIDVIQPVLAFIGILLLLSDSQGERRKVLATAHGLLLVLIACLLSEYGVATAAAGCVLLLGKAFQTTGARKRELKILALVLGFCALAAYAVFSILAASIASPAYRASFALQSGSADLLRMPLRLVSGLWRAIIGAFLESLGSVTVNGKVPLLSFFIGAVLSTAVTLALHRRKQTSSAGRGWPTALILTVAIIIGVLPFLLMGRTLETNWDSRFWLPVLPVASSLTVYLLLSVVGERHWILVAVCCGFLAGYWTSAEIFVMRRNRESHILTAHISS